MSLYYTLGRYLLSLFMLFALWEFAFILFDIPTYTLVPPSKVFATILEERASFWMATKITATNMLIGGFFGISLGVSLALLLGYSKKLKIIIEPYLAIFQSFPRESLFPLFVVWLGFGDLPKIVNAALLSFFPVAVTMLNALLNTPRDYLKLMDSWGASKREIFLYCRLPAALPSFIGALKFALPLALIGTVIGEFMGSSGGLGYIIITAGSDFRIDRLFAAIVLLANIGVLQLLFIQTLEEVWLKKYYF